MAVGERPWAGRAGTSMEQGELFGAEAPQPPGLGYWPELITPQEERDLVRSLSELAVRPFEFHGYQGARETISFGWRYEFDRGEAVVADAPPHFLRPLLERAADKASSLTPLKDRPVFEQALVTRYDAGAGIGWHRDKAVFGIVAGVSLGAACVLRFRRRSASGFDRRQRRLEPRSLYVLTAEARTAWEHSISPMQALRWSVTFRTRA